MSKTNSYVNITNEQMLENFKSRLNADERFKNLTSATVFQMFIEYLNGQFDLLNFYLGRTAEEQFFDTAKLPASFIKLAHNLGYAPKRPIPAQATVAVRLNGPLPNSMSTEKKYTLWFNKDLFPLYYNGDKYMLEANYSYEFTKEDITQGRNNPGWTKTIYLSRDKQGDYIQLNDVTKAYDLTTLNKIKVIQGEIAVAEIKAQNNLSSIGTNDQWYDIDDVEFSNYYGNRDPFSIGYDNVLHKENSVCKVGIGPDKETALANENLYDIEVNSISLNSQLLKNDTENSRKINICCIESNPDKTVRVRFGNGTTVSNGFLTKDDILFVQYLKTKGYAANKMGTTNSELKALAKVYAVGEGASIDVSSNVKIIFTSDITNGQNFESNIDIKNNAMLYYASGDKLVSREDFMAYFKALVKPIIVKNATILTKKDYNNIGNYSNLFNQKYGTKKDLNDTIGYCILSNLYRSINDGNYSPINFYDPDCPDILTNTLYTDFDGFLDGLYDTYKLLYNDPDIGLRSSYQAAALYIDGKIEDKLMAGTSVMPVQPIIHYFDLEGTVTVDDSTNIPDYQADVENRIYKWLDENSQFNNKIYKSDLVKMFYDNPATKRVNVDLNVSGLIKTKTTSFTSKVQANGLDTNTNYPWSIKTGEVNRVTIKSTDINNKSIDYSSLINEMVTATLTIDSSSYIIKTKIAAITPNNNGDLVIDFTDTFNDASTSYTYTNASLSIEYAIEKDYYSTSELGTNNLYKTNQSVYNNATQILTIISNHITAYTGLPTSKNNKIESQKDSYQDISNNNTLIDTFTDIMTWYGYYDGKNAAALTERWFNIDFISMLKKDVNLDDNSTRIAVKQTYPLLKFIFERNVLDENNNITHYTMPNEISVIRLKVTPIFEFGDDK